MEGRAANSPQLKILRPSESLEDTPFPTDITAYPMVKKKKNAHNVNRKLEVHPQETQHGKKKKSSTGNSDDSCYFFNRFQLHVFISPIWWCCFCLLSKSGYSSHCIDVVSSWFDDVWLSTWSFSLSATCYLFFLLCLLCTHQFTHS